MSPARLSERDLPGDPHLAAIRIQCHLTASRHNGYLRRPATAKPRYALPETFPGKLNLRLHTRFTGEHAGTASRPCNTIILANSLAYRKVDARVRGKNHIAHGFLRRVFEEQTHVKIRRHARAPRLQFLAGSLRVAVDDQKFGGG